MRQSANIEVLYTEQPWAQRFESAKKDGFDYIEFWGWEDKNLPEVKKLLDDNGLKISTMSGDGPYSMCDPATKAEYIAYIKRALDAAAQISCPCLVVHSDALEDEPKQYAKPLSADYSYDTKLLAMFDVLKTIAPMGEKQGVTFVLEALNIEKDHLGNFLNNSRMSADLVRAVGSKNVKMLYDAYHMYLDEGKICETLAKYLDLIGYIHVADAPGRGEPGTGAIQYRNVFLFLEKIGYDRVVGFELYPQKGTEAAIKAIRQAAEGL